ncbi:MAG: iron permease [Herminiimonas sp.]|nr:iron permease [Herminiimonas sp.]
MNKRRIVLRSISTVAAASAAGIPLSAFTQNKAQKLDEKDPQAVSLGYVDDTTRADKTKYPKHDNSQVCSGCQFYQGPASQPLAPCTIFGGKQVAAKGWCSAYVKKTAQGGSSS